MSDHRIILIPEDPHLMPDPAKIERARDRFAEIVQSADEIAVKVTETVEFFDCGANFESIHCPGCQSNVSTEWWQDRMDEDYGDGFRLATYAAPCCGAAVTLHELVYDWPQGFACFALEAMNPGIGTLHKRDKVELEHIVGTKLCVIHQHI